MQWHSRGAATPAGTKLGHCNGASGQHWAQRNGAADSLHQPAFAPANHGAALESALSAGGRSYMMRMGKVSRSRRPNLACRSNEPPCTRLSRKDNP